MVRTYDVLLSHYWVNPRQIIQSWLRVKFQFCWKNSQLFSSLIVHTGFFFFFWKLVFREKISKVSKFAKNEVFWKKSKKLVFFSTYLSNYLHSQERLDRKNWGNPITTEELTANRSFWTLVRKSRTSKICKFLTVRARIPFFFYSCPLVTRYKGKFCILSYRF